jgi:predicted hydrocarbon binding protein
MDVKNDIAGMYIKRYVIPNALILDKPGFVDFKISGKTNVFARQLLFPETFFIDMERKIIEKYENTGRKVLYSIGKKFGYSFAQLGRFENIKDHPGEEIKRWIVIASKFIEGTYASEITQTVEVNNEMVEFTSKNFAICRKLGYDYIFATGGAAGVVSWLFQDREIEAYYYDSKFEGEDHICKVKCAPFKTLLNLNKGIFNELNLDNLNQDIESYNKFNEEVELKYNKSFNSYLNAKVFRYHNGIIELASNKERFFLVEVSGLYLLELELKKNGMDDSLFETAKEVGKTIFKEFNSNPETMLEVLTALGWGEVLLASKENNKISIAINHFPWTSWYEKIDFLIIGGFLSGIFSSIYSRDIIFNKPKIDMHNNYLVLLFKEG